MHVHCTYLNSAISSVEESKYVPGWVNPRSSRQICSSSGFSYLYIKHIKCVISR